MASGLPGIFVQTRNKRTWAGVGGIVLTLPPLETADTVATVEVVVAEVGIGPKSGASLRLQQSWIFNISMECRWEGFPGIIWGDRWVAHIIAREWRLSLALWGLRWWWCVCICMTLFNPGGTDPVDRAWINSVRVLVKFIESSSVLTNYSEESNQIELTNFKATKCKKL